MRMHGSSQVLQRDDGSERRSERHSSGKRQSSDLQPFRAGGSRSTEIKMFRQRGQRWSMLVSTIPRVGIVVTMSAYGSSPSV